MFGLTSRSMGIKPVLEHVRLFHFLRKPLPTVYEPLPKRRQGEPVLEYVQKMMLAKHDPTGKRRALVRNDKDGLRAGDIVKVTYLDRSDVTGRILGVSRGHNNLGTNILLRTELNRLGSEIRIPVYNPNIRNIEVLYKPEKYLGRSKHYYVRGHKKLDVGDVEDFVKRERDALQKSLAKKEARSKKA